MAKWISSSNRRVTKYGGVDSITSRCLEMSLRKNIHVTLERHSHMTIKENAFSKHSHFVCVFISIPYLQKKIKKMIKKQGSRIAN